ncbi:hypothetical protein J2Z60_000351 [Lactobacillus colini]|uniref:type I site-specific deoxyribonuclease n=1 Tax=Lactobacillus colini TaxID=1819254 RepID=A0ABS4MBX6_9LACO|nr:hypothetical protein [Lactobacillus colini]
MESEATIENNLIHQLIHGESQWTLREDLKNEEQLWDNFFKILIHNNLNLLADNPLTENEKRIIRSKIVKPSFYKSAEWLAGANGQVRIALQRDDTSLGTADLLVIDNNDIAGGSSVYEVVHQISLHKRDNMNQNRRYDVTLLINGLPLIHIELKNKNHSTKEAFNQIQKYIDEGMFNDIFSNIQMFVISNGTDTEYIAANQQLKEKFLTHWVDEDDCYYWHIAPFEKGGSYLIEPIKVKGQLKLFNVDDKLIRKAPFDKVNHNNPRFEKWWNQHIQPLIYKPEKKVYIDFDKYLRQKVRIVDIDNQKFVGQVIDYDTPSDSPDGLYWLDVEVLNFGLLDISEPDIKSIEIID